jgi:hypothetical protein
MALSLCYVYFILKQNVMMLPNILNYCIAGMISVGHLGQDPSGTVLMPTVTCPATTTVDCGDLEDPYTSFEAFEDGGGLASGPSPIVDSTFRYLGATNPSLCVLERTYRVSDQAGNSSTCTQIINITGDTELPIARCKPLVVKLGGTTGTYTINPFNDLNNGSTDDCQITKYESDKPFVGCNDIGTTITYIMTVTDICGKTNTCSSTITTNSCPQDALVKINANNCSIVIPDLRPRLATFTPCQRPVNIVVQTPAPGTVVNTIHNMYHPITFMVSNGVGLMETCTMNVIAQDSTKPSITCKTSRLTLLSEVALRPDTLFSSVSDNCGINTLRYDIRRADNNCGSTIADDFGPNAVFCCTDVGRTGLSIIVRVTDINGNTATCFRNVRVLDGTPPSISIGSLPDITVSCSYPLNLSNLSAFGTLVPSTSPRADIYVNEPGNPFHANGFAGRDGVFTNCDGGTVTVSTRNLLNTCSQGRILRDFVVTDLSGNKASYTQTINVTDVAKFSLSDITWPAKNVTFEACSSVTPDPSVTGRPTLKNDKCSRADATYKDQKFTVDICGYIKRTWTVIDWCQYQTNNPATAGIYTFVQNISYANKSKPMMTGKTCRDTTVCVGTNCQATISLNATATDDCQPVSLTWGYKLDLNNNNTTDASVASNTLTNRVFSKGVHAITWTAKDRCNNSSSCKALITVKDCTPPSIIARNGIASNINSTFGNTTIWASEFVYSASDNCTPSNQIKYSFSTNVNNSSKVYTCSNRGNNPVDIWATDLDGNQSKVTSVINIQDNNKFCPNADDIADNRTIGNVKNESQFVGEPWPNPYSESVKIDVNVDKITDMQWIVWDVEGKIISSKNKQIPAGKNTVTLDEHGVKLQAGTYFYKVSVNHEQKVFRIVKI